MIIEYGPSVCTLRGDSGETEAVRALLTFRLDAKPFDPIVFLTEENQFLTGLYPDVAASLRSQGWEVETRGYAPPGATHDDLRQHPIPSLRGIEWRDYQIAMVRKAILGGRGTIDMATGAGKTEVGAGIVRWYLETGKASRALWVVNNLRLLQQTRERLLDRGFEAVGVVMGQETDLGPPLVVGMVQSLFRRMRKDHALMEWLEGVDVLVFDEAHHLPARTWTCLASACRNAHYRFGMSATAYDPEEPRVEDWTLRGITGPPLGYVPSWVLRQQGVLAEPEVVLISYSERRFHGDQWAKVYRHGIVENDERNALIADLAVEASRRGSRVLVFIAHVQHGKTLLEMICQHGAEARFCKGDEEMFSDDAQQETVTSSLREVQTWMRAEGSITIATSVFDEGIDVSEVDCLILAGGMKSHRRTVQRIGRGLRRKEGSNICRVYDFLDVAHPFLKSQTNKRLATYQRERISVRREVRKISI